MEGTSPDRDSIGSAARKSSFSSGRKVRRRKEFLRKFVDSNSLEANLTTWFKDIVEHNVSPVFDVPFELVDLQKFDYALEGVRFQQLLRMPDAVHASTPGFFEAAAYLALEDFLHATASSLWGAFWGHENDPMPFYVSSLSDGNLRFCQAEKEIAKGKVTGFYASAIMRKNPRHPQGKWDDIVELALLRPDVQILASIEDNSEALFSILGEALFFALRVLLARSIGRSNVPLSLTSVFVLLLDSQHGSVVKVEGDLNNLEFDVNNVYGSAAAWFKNHSRIAISPVDRIWNKLGNANWGDIGALQVLYSTFHSIANYAGSPKHTVEDLATEHSSRLQRRRSKRQLGDTRVNGNGSSRIQHYTASPEIVEVEEESIEVATENSTKLEIGTILQLEDSRSENGYRIDDIRYDGDFSIYVTSPIDKPEKSFFLYIGSEYQVQRQTKVLTVMTEKGLSSKYLPRLYESSRAVHSGRCRKLSSSSSGKCGHRLCGIPVVLTTPVGRTVGEMVSAGEFGADEAIRCCHDCLSALSASSSAGIRHGDIRPENVICVKSGGRPYYSLIGWGYAILEERDHPATNLHFSSTSALQDGKLCSASDAESLVYMLYFASGGDSAVLDSVEGALQWRETSWSRRLIQQKLGEISAVLKAFADYVDSLCGTPYPVNYDIWLRRLRRHISEDDSGKEIDTST
ncbi:uncharacterized protein LOC127263643 [Andrographis paniculata]|uniref:uncharacterized protein LOC127263643 n=1 Tax=Andrographis paniculata TaxID=175694 RepID=UPI0021E74E4D|nr:uncharacterized protein LOC127263643 [Andrographis paniculata]